MSNETPATSDGSSNKPPRKAIPVRHKGPCGERIPCPCGTTDFGPGVVNVAERLRDGTVICHGCGLTRSPVLYPGLAA